VWAFAAHYPEKTVAVAGLCVPYRFIEHGLDHIVTLGDRKLYPQDQFPDAQWSYMRFHNAHPDKFRDQIDVAPEAVAKLLFAKHNPADAGQPCATAFVMERGGLFPDGAPDIPVQFTILEEHPEILEKLAETIRVNGTHGPNDYYRNFPTNAAYLATSKNGGNLDFPVLFIGATYDFVLDTITNPKQLDDMREHCSDLQEVHIDAGHWVALEKPAETNAALAGWLKESVKDWWPGPRLERPGKANL
jgi:soluble epoxide hydrolase/lipid-phosphate phosphatase